MSFTTYYRHTLLASTFFVFLSCTVHFTVDWFRNEHSRKSFEKEKLTAELSFLKSQINPHFLLNSLNNIYSLAYQRSEKTAEAVLKLSEIMKYMLYESNDMRVPISKEIHYLENYVELQKIRLKDSAFVELDVEGDVSQTIVPLILIPFIENAFKHGVINDRANPVRIRVRATTGKLLIRVSNKKNQYSNKDDTGGIGLHNVSRRLALLYPGRHHLVINEDTDQYTCELSLDL
nr:histidine kinase [Hufsiella ginkgonis]